MAGELGEGGRKTAGRAGNLPQETWESAGYALLKLGVLLGF